MTSERLQFVAILLFSGLLAVVSMGFAGGPAADDPAPEQLVREAIESTNNASIQGVRTEIFQRDDQFEMVTVSVAEQPPGQSRVEVIEAIETDDRSDLTVVNGSTMWQYFSDERRAVRMEVDGQVGSRTPLPGLSAREMLDEYDVTYAGTDTVEGRETHVVDLSPPDGTGAALSLDVQAGDSEYEFQLQEADREQWFLTRETWWLDKETAYPIKQRVEWTDPEGEVIATSIRKYHEITVGAELEDERFGFDSPEGVEVTEPKLPETETYASRERAASAVPFEIPEPAVPAAYDLHEVTVQSLDGNRSVMLTYLQGSERITFHVSEQPIHGDSDRTVETDVGGVSGTLVTSDGRPSLTWDCHPLSYRVTGPHQADLLTAIAESVGCDTATADPTADDGWSDPWNDPHGLLRSGNESSSQP